MNSPSYKIITLMNIESNIGAVDTIFCDKVCQWLATGRWFPPGSPVFFINKTDRHDISEILLSDFQHHEPNHHRIEYTSQAWLIWLLAICWTLYLEWVFLQQLLSVYTFSMLCYLIWFRRIYDVMFVFTPIWFVEGSCFIYVTICVA